MSIIADLRATLIVLFLHKLCGTHVHRSDGGGGYGGVWNTDQIALSRLFLFTSFFEASFDFIDSLQHTSKIPEHFSSPLNL